MRIAETSTRCGTVCVLKCVKERLEIRARTGIDLWKKVLSGHGEEHNSTRHEAGLSAIQKLSYAIDDCGTRSCDENRQETRLLR